MGIAQAILANPETVILDEPTVGLDPIQIIEIRDLIKSLGSEHTVILSSHILSEVSTICDEIIVISHGKLVAIDTPKNLESKFSNSNITEFIIRGDKVIVENAFNKISEIDKFTISDSSDGTVKVTVESMAEDISDRVFFAMAKIHTPIIQSNKKHASLEDIFIELTDEKQQPEAIEKSDKEENENASDL